MAVSLVPLVVAVPLLAAALLAAATERVPRRLADATGVGVGIVVAGTGTVLVAASRIGGVVHWVGGWEPIDGMAIAIPLVADPLSAGLVAFAGAVTATAFLYSWGYFRSIGTMYHALILMLLGALCGFLLTGDLFNMFVFVELMSIAAYATTAYKVEERGPLQAAFNFAVTNTIGASLLLFGVGMVYARAGTLNLAELGPVLADGPLDATVVIAFSLIATGFLVKAAIIPFHLWQPDVYAAAPSPAVMVFAGIMTKAGLYGIARVHTTVFADVLEPLELHLSGVLVGLGLFTAVVAAVLSFVQLDLKRLLAFSSLSHIGIVLVGVGLFETAALAGALVYIVGHGLVKGALFAGAGVLLHRCATVAIDQLHGAGRSMPLLGVAFAVGGLALAALPPSGMFLGKTLIEKGAEEIGWGWIGPVMVAAGIVTGAAVLRATARVFLGWGSEASPPGSEIERVDAHDEPYTEADHDRTPLTMALAVALPMVAGLVIGLVPQAIPLAERAAVLADEAEIYRTAVLDPPVASEVELPGEEIEVVDVIEKALGAAGAAVLMALVLVPFGAGSGEGHVAARWSNALARRARAWQSGDVGDYVAWLTVGAAAFGAILVAGLI